MKGNEIPSIPNSRAEKPKIEKAPQFEDEKSKRYEVGMFEVALIEVDNAKEVTVRTEGASSCVVTIGFFISPDGNKFCLFSHLPYHLGNEFDEELKDPRIVESVKKEVIAVVQAQVDNRDEVRTLNKIFNSKLKVFYRQNTIDSELREYDTVVEMHWKPDSNPTVSFLNENLSWKAEEIKL